MPINVVHLPDLKKHIADTIAEVYQGVAIASKACGHQIELPASIDFKLTVIAEGGWQALESKTKDTTNAVEDGTANEKGQSKDTQSSQESQGGTTKETRTGSGSESSSSKSETSDDGINAHNENVASTQTSKRS